MNLLAAQNTASLSGSTKSDSGSVGISVGTGGFGVTASASSARGKEAGDNLTHTNTHITAGNQVSINSGGDTTLQGALVKADTIQADIGGNLKIESLQDTSTYDNKQNSVSASVTVGPTGDIQGMKGTLFGVPCPPGSWQDKLIESFAGPHDYIGGSVICDSCSSNEQPAETAQPAHPRPSKAAPTCAMVFCSTP